MEPCHIPLWARWGVIAPCSVAVTATPLLWWALWPGHQSAVGIVLVGTSAIAVALSGIRLISAALLPRAKELAELVEHHQEAEIGAMGQYLSSALDPSLKPHRVDTGPLGQTWDRFFGEFGVITLMLWVSTVASTVSGELSSLMLAGLGLVGALGAAALLQWPVRRATRCIEQVRSVALAQATARRPGRKNRRRSAGG